jgi:membrane protein YqaA with SNARE-associated domain
VLLFHQLGWQQLHALYPALLDSPGWRRVAAWTGEYGVVALFVVAALPVPQTPALIFCAIASVPGPDIFFAMLFGKAIKYSVLGALAARFPAKFRVFLNMIEPARGVPARRGWG